MTKNEEQANIFAKHLGIKNGVIVNSGTIALLSALKVAGIKSGDNVLLNGYCCYSLFEAIMNVGANPIFVIPENFYNISLNEIREVLSMYKIKCFIATHQYGIVQDIKSIKKDFPSLIIIEDIAQAWNIKENELGIGKYSDYVVTSFGLSKALSYGQAGAIFSDNSFRQYFDFHDKESRNSSHFLLPYALYECDNINAMALINNANNIIEKQRAIAILLTKYFEENENCIVYRDRDFQLSSWHKFPVIIKNLDYIPIFERILERNEILFQWQNEKEIWELEMVKNYNPNIIIFGKKPIYALIRTKQNDIEKVKKLIRSKK